ncbi:hypothetical protein Xoosp13_263 [Xanthomonas phage Xoo-sp13]|nr:hypothetical protein Xoosp13_263 [Xanthomonas phage Xoo-sp13]
MNGKMAKMLRKLNRESPASKRNFNALTATEKGKLREVVTTMETVLSDVMYRAEDSAPVTGELV